MNKKQQIQVFAIGDQVTTKEAVEALYSEMYKGTKSEYPSQWFEPGMIGTVVAVSSPSVRRNINQYVIEFEGEPMSNGGVNWNENASKTWRVRLDPSLVTKINTHQ